MEDVVVRLDSTASALKVTLRDLLVFMTWLERAQRAYENGDFLPATPELGSDRVRSWVHLVETLQTRCRQSEDKQMSLEANLQAQETEVARLVTNLHENIAALYDNLGRSQKAQEVRRRAAGVHPG